MSVQVVNYRRPIYLIGALVISLLLNGLQFYKLLDVGITTTYQSVSIDTLRIQRDVAIAVCNAALINSQRSSIIEAASAISSNIVELPKEQTTAVGEVGLKFNNEKLVQLFTYK